MFSALMKEWTSLSAVPSRLLQRTGHLAADGRRNSRLESSYDALSSMGKHLCRDINGELGRAILGFVNEDCPDM